MKLIFIFLITILDSHMYALNVEAMVGNSLYKSPDFKAQIVMKCGYYNQYLDRTGVWLSDPQGTCTNNYTAITEYCKSIYPTLNITNVLPMGDKPIKVDNWCAPNQIKCDKSFQVVPIRCLEGKFQSEALLVPEGCVFDHVHSSKLCIGEGYWHNIALQACAKKYEIPENIKGYNYSMLRSYSMLLPCGIAAFSGVEFVCCKSSQSQISATPTMNLVDAAGTPLPNHVAKKSPDAVALNRKSLSSVEQMITQKPLVVSNVVVKNSKVNSLVDNVNVDYKPLEPSIGTSEEILNFSATNMKREDLTDKTNPLPISFTTSTPSTPDTDTKSTRNNTTTNNIINDKIILDPINNNKIDSNSEEASTTISSNINDENLIKSYYATFDKDKEHERFVDVKNWMKDKRRKTIINLMKDWTLSEKRFNQIKSKDPYLAQKYKEDISKSFQKTISALEAEEKAQKKQLTAIHEQRVTSLLNAKKRRFMFQFLKELEKPYPTPELLKETLERLLRAEERDKMHVIHYYEHLLNSDPSAASRVRAVVARHIADVERRMNRSVIMLERRLKPEIYAKLKPQIDGFVNTIKTRNGDFAELTRSIVNEKEVSTLAYTAGASTSTADDKTDTTTQEVPDLQSSSQSLNSNNDKPEEADDENYDDEADEDETDDENEEADDINDETTDVSEKNLFKKDIASKAEANEAYNNNTSEGGNVETNKIKGDNDRDLLPYPFVNIPSHDFAHTNENSKAAKRSGPSPHYEALSQESGMVSSALHGNGKRSTTFNMGVVFSVMAALAVVIAAALMIKKYVTRKSRFVMYAPPGGLNKNHPHQHAPIPTREEDCPDYLPPLNFGRPNYNSGGRDNNRGGIGMFGNCGGISRNQLFKKNLATVAQPSGNIGLPSQCDKDNVSNHVEIDNQSLEERHLANMQVNGYENPTYRYFEKIASKA